MKSKFTIAKRTELVEKQQRSELSVAEFARQNKIKPSTFQYWIKRLKEEKKGKLVKVDIKPVLSPEPTLLMINNIKLEIPASISSMKIAKIISVIREDI